MAAPKTPTRESHIEARLVKRAKEEGGEIRKIRWIGRSKAPDRVLMFDPARAIARLAAEADVNEAYAEQLLYELIGLTIAWPEVKAPGGCATFPKNAHERAQHREHERMRAVGQRVEVIDSYEQIEELFK